MRGIYVYVFHIIYKNVKQVGVYTTPPSLAILVWGIDEKLQAFRILALRGDALSALYANLFFTGARDPGTY
jgi:hypothetical protein